MRTRVPTLDLDKSSGKSSQMQKIHKTFQKVPKENTGQGQAGKCEEAQTGPVSLSSHYCHL